MTIPEAQATLARLRTRIDGIDRDILALLNRRAAIAKEIGAVKHAAGLAVYEEGRERQVVDNMVAANSGPLPDDAVERIFSGIMIEMRNLQKPKE